MNKNNLIFLRVYMLFQLLTRICLTIYAAANQQIELVQIPGIFVAGLINDVISLSYALPFIVIFTTSFSILLQKIRIPLLPVAAICYFILIAAMIFNLISEVVFWDEFGTRYNFIAVDYLIYTQEIIGTVIESMPVVPILCGIALIGGVISVASISSLRSALAYASHRVAINVFVLAIATSGLAFAFYDSDKLTFSGNIYAQELGKNGPYEFFSAYRNNSLNYLKFYPSIDAKEARDIVRAEILQPNQKFVNDDGVERETLAIGAKAVPRVNIIIITIESMSAEYMTRFGSRHNITPNLDRLAGESIFFANLYAAGTRTVRGLEALSLGVPPTPGSSILRRTNNHGLFNIASPLKDLGYESTFFFGGMSYFDNLDNYFSGNGYKVIDRTNLASNEITFSNVWGVADEDILSRAISEADKSYAAGRPFFSFVMTTNNHRPYTFPEGKIDLPSGSGRNAAVKYTDYAIGKFIEEAKSKPWFGNTIFIITADHCASSAGKTHLPVNKYHIPLLIYAPKMIKPQRVESLTSQIDIPPTVLGLLGIDYKSKFMGKDVLHYPSGRAFIGTYQMLGFMKDGHLVVLAPKMDAKVYKLKDNQQIEVRGMEGLVREAISFYQTAYTNFTEGKMRE